MVPSEADWVPFLHPTLSAPGNWPDLTQAATRRSVRLRPIADIICFRENKGMSEERVQYGVPIDPAERMQQFMLALFDVMDEADLAGFPSELLDELNRVRLLFVDEFERRHPGYGKGRAICR
jgi:hypothetical protein